MKIMFEEVWMTVEKMAVRTDRNTDAIEIMSSVLDKNTNTIDATQEATELMRIRIDDNETAV